VNELFQIIKQVSELVFAIEYGCFEDVVEILASRHFTLLLLLQNQLIHLIDIIADWFYSFL